MNEVVAVYVTCESEELAKDIGLELLKKHLCACIKVISGTYAAYYWPQKSKNLIETTESTLLIMTEKDKYNRVEQLVRKLHTDKVPCILSFPVEDGNPDYLRWLKGEINQ